MTSRVIRPGETQTLYVASALSGTLTIQGGLLGGAGGTGIVSDSGVLINRGDVRVMGGAAGRPGADYSNQGASVEVYGTLTNDGFIGLHGGAAGLSGASGTSLGGKGAVLNVAGTLDNAGTIQVDSGVGGVDSGMGAELSIEGVFTNIGRLGAWGGTGSPDPSGAGTILNTGTLVNRGVIQLHSGSLPTGWYQPGGPAATLTNAGTLTNQGTLLIDGGAGIPTYGDPQGIPGAHGGVLNNTGVLTNTGSIELGGGGGGILYYGGFGGTLTDGGTLTNSGRLSIAGGSGSGYADGRNPGFLAAMLTVTGFLFNTGTLAILGGHTSTFSSYEGPGGVLVDSGVVDNSGSIILGYGGSGYETGGTLSVKGVLNDTGAIIAAIGQRSSEIRLESGATLSLSGAATIGPANIANYGGMISGSGLISSGLVSIGGTVVASGGLLAITGGLFDTGILDVKAGATLDLSGDNNSGDTVNLNPQGLLQVNGPIAGVTDEGTVSLLIDSPHGGTVDVLGGGTAALNTADTDLTVRLAQATTLTLSKMGFVTAIGSSGNDTMTALAAGQTLTGGAGADTLIGSAVTRDTFLDSAAGLNGDTIGDFAGHDVIDVTDLAPGATLSLAYAQEGSKGALTLSEGGVSTTITLLGSFTQGQFTTGTDGHEGVLIGLQPGG